MIDLRSCQLIVEFCLPGKWQRRWNSPSNKPKSTSNRRRRNEPFWWSPKCLTDPDVRTSDLTPIYSSSFVYEPVHYRHPSTRYVASVNTGHPQCTCFHTNERLYQWVKRRRIHKPIRLKCNWRQVTVWIDGCYKDYSDVLCVLVYFWTFQLKVSWFVLFYEVHCICYFTFVKEAKDFLLVKHNLVWFSVYNNLFFLLSSSNGKITTSWITVLLN